MDDRALTVLRDVFGLAAFRPGQREAISASVAGRDVCCFLPTGAGKSLCFQLPALLADGIVLVISPLIALMDDQVAGLTRRGVRARVLSSGRSVAENRETLRLLREEPTSLDILYASPEGMASSRLLDALAATVMGNLGSNNSEMFGARTACEIVPLRLSSEVGAQVAPNFQVVASPSVE